MEIRSVGIIARTDKKEAIELAGKICKYLEQKGIETLLESSLASPMNRTGVEISKIVADLFIVIGGDGTILRTCASIKIPETPILTINMGARGLIAEVRPEHAFKAIERVLEGKYFLEECVKISTTLNEEELPDALNEVLLITSSAKAQHFSITIGNNPPLRFSADGFILSTPLGSTAHSFSAGGPVIEPSVEAFVLTPICPLIPLHPIVFSSANQVYVKLEEPQQTALLVVDGHCKRHFNNNDTLLIKMSKHKARFIRLTPFSFYNRLINKVMGGLEIREKSP